MSTNNNQQASNHYRSFIENLDHNQEPSPQVVRFDYDKRNDDGESIEHDREQNTRQFGKSSPVNGSHFMTGQMIGSKISGTSNKCAFDLQVQQLQSRLFHQVILKSQLSSQSQFDRQVLKKLSSSTLLDLSQTLTQLHTTDQKLTNPLLNPYQKQQIKQTLLTLQMQSLALTKVLVNTYRHHEYRLVVGLLHIARAYVELKCYEQAVGHLENALMVNQGYRHVGKDVEYFHSVLLSFLALAQFEGQELGKSLENLNKALEIHETLKSQHYQCHDFFPLNLISKVLIAAGKKQQALSLAKMALDSARNDYSSESVQFANACKTLSQAECISNDFQPSLQHIREAIRVLQVHYPSLQATIIDFYEKLTQITLKQLNTMKPQQPSQNYYEPYIQVIKKKYETIENTYGYRDKRVIKEKRHLASVLLKYGRVEMAEEELEDILEIQETVYGEKSVEVAKTLKLLGTVAMSLNQAQKAEKHLKKSMGIFHDQGQVNLQKEVQAKLMILTGKGKFLINTKA